MTPKEKKLCIDAALMFFIVAAVLMYSGFKVDGNVDFEVIRLPKLMCMGGGFYFLFKIMHGSVAKDGGKWNYSEETPSAHGEDDGINT